MKFFIISVVILGILFALVPHIVYLLAKVVGLIAHFKVTYKYFGFTALGLFVLISVLMTYGYAFGRFRSEVTTFDFESESVPGAFDGYKIVQISDLHLDGWKGNSEHLKKRIDEINAINPDLVCFTGDLVSLSPSEIDGFKPILKNSAMEPIASPFSAARTRVLAHIPLFSAATWQRRARVRRECSVFFLRTTRANGARRWLAKPIFRLHCRDTRMPCSSECWASLHRNGFIQIVTAYTSLEIRNFM